MTLRMRCAVRAAALPLLLALAVPAPAQTAGQSPRTFVEGLEVSSPEAVLATLLEAWSAADYFTVHYLLSAEARLGFRRAYMSTFSFAPLLPGVEGTDLPGSRVADLEVEDDLSRETFTDPALFFDDVLFAAQKNGFLPFDFGPAAEILSIQANGVSAIAEIGTDADPGRLSVTLIRLSNGDWRIDAIRWDGSDPDARPWGVEAAGG